MSLIAAMKSAQLGATGVNRYLTGVRLAAPIRLEGPRGIGACGEFWVVSI
jgi:hypothetical protein